MAAQAMLQAASEEVPEGVETSNKKRKMLPNVLEDDRFKAMFEDPSFAVDEAAEEYKIYHPNAGKTLLDGRMCEGLHISIVHLV